MSYFTTVKHEDGSDIELYINDEQHIKELKAKVKDLETENVEMLNECSAYAEYQETLETQVSNLREKYDALFMASNAVAIEHDDGTTKIIV